jgi:hypothetical protein
MSDDSIPSLPDRIQHGLSFAVIIGLAVVPVFILILIGLDGGITPLVKRTSLWLFIIGFGFPLWASVVAEAVAYINPDMERS